MPGMTQSRSEPLAKSMVMPAGRSLAFAEWGSPDGRPVLYLHGIPSSRLEHWPDDAALARLDVRLVTFDRPGYGRSGPMPGRVLLDCAADVERLADHLGLEDFAVAGISGGGPFVLAVAWALSDRVTRAAISCGLGPLDRPGALEGMSPANAEEFEIARQEPDRLTALLEGLDLLAAMPEDEMAAFGLVPGLAEMMLQSASEATRQGWLGVVADDLAFVGPWGFDLDEITVALRLWHGDRDALVPIHHSQFVAAQVPSAQLNTCAGEGHLAMFAHQEEVLDWLTGE